MPATAGLIKIQSHISEAFLAHPIDISRDTVSVETLLRLGIITPELQSRRKLPLKEDTS